MKKLVTLALVLASANAFATRARVSALGNASHLLDAATVYGNPAHILKLSDSLTIESGATNITPATVTAAAPTTVNNGAEGLLIRSIGESKFALSLGHDDKTIYRLREAAVGGTAGIRGQQNPVELMYGQKMGDMGLAAGLYYSNFQNKTTEEKEGTMGLRFGLGLGIIAAELQVGLMDKWQKDTPAPALEYKGKTLLRAKVSADVMPDLNVYGEVLSAGFKTTSAGGDTEDVDAMEIKIGAISAMKKEGTEFFYGIALASETAKEKVADSKSTKMYLPMIIGLESEANSWLTLRGSVTQKLVFMDSEKVETAGAAPTTDTNPGANSTTFAAGAGLRFNKVSVDGTILAAGGQNINGANLLGTVGLTYVF